MSYRFRLTREIPTGKARARLLAIDRGFWIFKRTSIDVVFEIEVTVEEKEHVASETWGVVGTRWLEVSPDRTGVLQMTGTLDMLEGFVIGYSYSQVKGEEHAVAI